MFVFWPANLKNTRTHTYAQGFFAAARSLILPENRETRLSAFPDTPLSVLIAQVQYLYLYLYLSLAQIRGENSQSKLPTLQ